MKKYLILIFTIVIFFHIEGDAQTYRYGIKGGINLSNIKSEYTNPNPDLGFTLGGFFNYNYTDIFVIQYELMYSLQRTKGNILDVKRRISLINHYISLPITSKFYLNDLFNIQVGGQVNYLFAYTIKGNHKKDIFNNLDFGANIGFGYDYSKTIAFSLRYYIGLTNIKRTEDSATNTNIQLGITYRLNYSYF